MATLQNGYRLRRHIGAGASLQKRVDYTQSTQEFIGCGRQSGTLLDLFFAVGHAFAVPALLGLRHGNSDKGKRSERDGGHQGRNAPKVEPPKTKLNRMFL
jgi:hypothetical protein